jgi:SlyX protein
VPASRELGEDTMTEERIIELETKISHQELAIEDLQQAVYDQQKSIEALRLRVERLAKQLDGVTGEGAPEIGPANDKPPHY